MIPRVTFRPGYNIGDTVTLRNKVGHVLAVNYKIPGHLGCQIQRVFLYEKPVVYNNFFYDVRLEDGTVRKNIPQGDLDNP